MDELAVQLRDQNPDFYRVPIRRRLLDRVREWKDRDIAVLRVLLDRYEDHFQQSGHPARCPECIALEHALDYASNCVARGINPRRVNTSLEAARETLKLMHSVLMRPDHAFDVRYIDAVLSSDDHTYALQVTQRMWFIRARGRAVMRRDRGLPVLG
jgi:hypothetical protein